MPISILYDHGVSLSNSHFKSKIIRGFLVEWVSKFLIFVGWLFDFNALWRPFDFTFLILISHWPLIFQNNFETKLIMFCAYFNITQRWISLSNSHYNSKILWRLSGFEWVLNVLIFFFFLIGSCDQTIIGCYFDFNVFVAEKISNEFMSPSITIDIFCKS